MRRMVRIFRFTGRPVGKLRRHRFAEDDGARGPQHRHARRILFGLMALEQRRAVLRRHICRIDDVLDADRQPMQRPKTFTGGPMLVGRTAIGRATIDVLKINQTEAVAKRRQIQSEE